MGVDLLIIAVPVGSTGRLFEMDGARGTCHVFLRASLNNNCHHRWQPGTLIVMIRTCLTFQCERGGS